MKTLRDAAPVVRPPRWRRGALLVSQAAILVGAVLTYLAVERPGPFRVGAFLVLAEPAIVVGVVLYVIVAVGEFLGSRGIARMHFDAGDTIFRQGDPGDCMYAVIEGEVEVVVEREGAEPTAVARLGPGQYFGEMALVSEGPRNATVRARTPVEVAVMGRVQFGALYAYVPDFQKSIEEVVRRRRTT